MRWGLEWWARHRCKAVSIGIEKELVIAHRFSPVNELLVKERLLVRWDDGRISFWNMTDPRKQTRGSTRPHLVRTNKMWSIFIHQPRFRKIAMGHFIELNIIVHWGKAGFISLLEERHWDIAYLFAVLDRERENERNANNKNTMSEAEFLVAAYIVLSDLLIPTLRFQHIYQKIIGRRHWKLMSDFGVQRNACTIFVYPLLMLTWSSSRFF